MPRKLSEHTTERAADEAAAQINDQAPCIAYVKRTGSMKRRWAVLTDFAIDPIPASR